MGLLVALHKPGVSESVRQLVTLLESLGLEVAMPKEVANLLDRPNTLSIEDLTKIDALIALGGDGCVLSAARLAAPHNVPILGVRVGGFGFLAEVEIDHFDNPQNRCHLAYLLHLQVVKQHLYSKMLI
ncbi:MAG: NAD(+)/NADH kinase [Armatimonadota bacterium]